MQPPTKSLGRAWRLVLVVLAGLAAAPAGAGGDPGSGTGPGPAVQLATAACGRIRAEMQDRNRAFQRAYQRHAGRCQGIARGACGRARDRLDRRARSLLAEERAMRRRCEAAARDCTAEIGDWNRANDRLTARLGRHNRACGDILFPARANDRCARERSALKRARATLGARRAALTGRCR